VPNTRRRADYEPVLQVAQKAQYVYFLHTAVLDDSPINSIAARYRIDYEDGTGETLPVRMKNDISSVFLWSLAGWQYTHGGLRLYIMPCQNPHPDKTIVDITLLDGDIPETPLLLGITLA
jgi:hypothetical protein